MSRASRGNGSYVEYHKLFSKPDETVRATQVRTLRDNRGSISTKLHHKQLYDGTDSVRTAGLEPPPPGLIQTGFN